MKSNKIHVGNVFLHWFPVPTSRFPNQKIRFQDWWDGFQRSGHFEWGLQFHVQMRIRIPHARLIPAENPLIWKYGAESPEQILVLRKRLVPAMVPLVSLFLHKQSILDIAWKLPEQDRFCLFSDRFSVTSFKTPGRSKKLLPNNTAQRELVQECSQALPEPP